MRTIILFSCIVFFSLNLTASVFEDAVKHYQSEDYYKAFKKFELLAELKQAIELDIKVARDLLTTIF